MVQDVSVKVAKMEQHIESNTRRIVDLEQNQTTLNRLATAVEVLAAKQNTIGQSVERLNEKMDSIEQKPAKRWERLVDKFVSLLLGAFMSYLLVQCGLL